MTTTAVHDLVPAALRHQWAELGHYPDRDIYDLFAVRVFLDPLRTAVIDDDGELTYGQLNELALRMAANLAARGVRPGDVVAVQLPNGRYAVAADLAVAAVGGVMLPFPVGRGENEARSLVRRSGAVGLIADDPGRAWTTAELLAPAGVVEPVRSDPNGPARILVSSGSEAEPKMVLYSHNALLGGRGAFVGRLIPPGEELRALFLVPLASSFGSNGTTVTLARHGGTLVLQGKFTPESTVELIERARPTHLFGVPTMFKMLLSQPGDYSSIRVIAPGGAQLDAATAQACREFFDAIVVNVYGSADGVNCHTALDDPPGSGAGRPNPAVAEILVVDDARQPLPAGEVGEIIARGPMSPLRYVDDDLNARYRTEDGWVRTGDLGVFDEAGYLSVVGRRKDIVIRGGANISPAEVEQALAAHPSVRDVACVGVPDELMGERLCACLVVSEPVTVAGLGEFLSGLARYKHPEHLLVLPEFPLNPAGKVDRDALRLLARRAPR
ncbi:class I adenylate-forming enzyme family protein [Lentzea sp. NBRC 102530]|uniref:class I adenylate-forming enzyme family protein n=1 Tax=Lentzea sp. NBRC 102530 TaxID=3032201 RepID=UPI0024A4C21E|nr:class I adenylate-forming enzyme family protein [Lentzea sp. NBRC 102530]GLY47353.1 AMP-dependent synthetase [Lentzea sp. NBRC 102530]